MQDIPTKFDGVSTLPADEFNQIPDEMENLIQNTGIVLAGADTSQMSKSVANYVASGDFYTDSGIANSYVLSAQGLKQSPTAYVDGMRVRYEAGNTNTGPAVINVSGLGLKDIKDNDYVTNLVANDIIGGFIYDMTFSASNDVFVISGSTSVIDIDGIPDDYVKGFLLVQNVADTSHEIDVNIGVGSATNNKLPINLKAVLNKKINVNWAEGTNQGGFPSGLTLANDTWYHFFVIVRADGKVDAGFDTNTNAVNLLADATGYTGFLRVGSVITNASADIFNFTEILSPTGGRRFVWQAPQLDINDTTPGITANVATIRTPLGFEVDAIVNISAQSAAGSTTIRANVSSLFSLDEVVTTSSAPLPNLFTANAVGNFGYNKIIVMTNNLSQIRYRFQTDLHQFRLSCLGWKE